VAALGKGDDGLRGIQTLVGLVPGRGHSQTNLKLQLGGGFPLLHGPPEDARWDGVPLQKEALALRSQVQGNRLGRKPFGRKTRRVKPRPPAVHRMTDEHRMPHRKGHSSGHPVHLLLLRRKRPPSLALVHREPALPEPHRPGKVRPHLLLGLRVRLLRLRIALAVGLPVPRGENRLLIHLSGHGFGGKGAAAFRHRRAGIRD